VDNLKQKTFKAFAWDMAGKLADQGIGFFISIILARLLAPEEFGLLAMVSVVIALARVFIDSGLGTALIQRKDVTDAHYGSVFWFNITAGSFLTLLFFLLSGVIAGFYNRPELKPIMQVLSFSFIIDSFARVQAAWLTKQLKFGVLTKARITSLIISGSVGVTLAFMHYGVWALVVQSMLSAVITNIYITIFSGFRPKLIYSFNALKELWGFGFRMFLSGMINTITRQVDNLIIGKMYSPATLGFYYRAKSLNEFVIKYTSGSLMPVLFPTLSSIQDDEKRYNNIVIKSFHVLNFIGLLISAILYLTAEDIIIILFSTKWLPAVKYFKIIIIGSVGYIVSSLLVNILSSKGNSRGFLKLGIYKQSLIILNLIIGLSFNIEMYLYGRVFIIYIGVVLNIFFASKQLNQSAYIFFRIIFKYTLLTVVLLSSILLIKQYFIINNIFLHAIFYGMIFLFTYIIANFLLKFEAINYIINEIKRK
jgi:O-antigen/teichoic acid export membrane protein